MRVVNAFGSSSTLEDSLARTALDIKSIIGRQDYRKFVIVGMARTGSTLLINLLNSHSQALVFGELFRSPDSIGWDIPPFETYQNARLLALYQSDPLAFLRTSIFRRWPRAIAAVGFKLFYYHAREFPYSATWDYLEKNTDILVLHIKRKNVLEQFLSLRLAHLTDVWSSTQAFGKAPEPVRLEAEACQEHFTQVRKLEAECDAFFAKHEVKPVSYEDLTGDRAAEMQSVLRFLGLRPEPMSTKIVRQRTEPLSRAIANYDELKGAFANTEWADFFGDPGK